MSGAHLASVGRVRALAKAKLEIMGRMDEEYSGCCRCPNACVEEVRLVERDEIAIRAFCKVKTGVCDVNAFAPPSQPLTGVWTDELSELALTNFKTDGFIRNIRPSSAHGGGLAFDVNAGEQMPFRRVNKDAPRTVTEEVW